jgi:DNA-binding SARP family transcriptional activator/Tfp pilus assembly protein PilF
MRFSLLGPMRVFDGDQSVSLRGAMRRTILAALLLNADSVVSTDHLASLLWADGQPASAMASLYNQINRLRHDLGEAGSRIEARSPGYLFRVEPGELDVQTFAAECAAGRSALAREDWQRAADHYSAALALWRGRPLADVPGLADHLRIRELEENRWEALYRRIEADLRLGRSAALISELNTLIAEQPLREAFHGQLMLALYQSGRVAAALDVYHSLRAMLAEELGVEPSASVQDVHRSLLKADDRDADDRAPRQLPADTRAFTGREEEVERLVKLAAETASGAPVVCAIDGMGGVGKTTLAVHAAHRLAEAYPDGQLFLDLHGHTQDRSPRSAQEALGWLLRALGVAPAQVPKDAEQAAALYRQRLADSRTLIVLDNAAGEAQLRPLLPGGGQCLVLVTSRRRLRALDDAHAIPLDLLPPQDAATLLSAAAGPGRAAAGDPLLDEIAELCGHLPLALRIAGALLRHRPSWPLEHLATQLRERVHALSDGERDVAAVFDLSYANLDAPHRLLLRRLGLVPGPDLDACAAAALLDITPVAAAELLQDLVDHNLLIEYRVDRYRLHDLMRAHALTLVAADPAADRDAAVDRLLHYYAYTAQIASICAIRHPRPAPERRAPAHIPALADPDSANSWLLTEHANLEAAFAHAEAHDLDEHAMALAAGLGDILLGGGSLARALEIHQAAAAVAERVGRPAGQAAALVDMSKLRYLAGDFTAAGEAATRALEIYRALGDRFGEANALVDLARVRYLAGEFPDANEATSSALEIYRTLGNRLGEAYALGNLGWGLYIAGEFAEAADAATRALGIYREIGSRYGESAVLGTLGLVQYVTGDYATAIDTLTRGVELDRSMGNHQAEAGSLNYLGRVLHLTGDYAAAGTALTRSLEIFRVLGNRQGEAEAINSLGRVREATGDLTGAAEAHARCLEIYRELDTRQGEAYALVELGRVQTAAEQYPEALVGLTSALEMYRALGYPSHEAWTLNFYAAALAGNGRHAEAFAHFQRALAMNRELDKPDDEALALEGLGGCHSADGDTETATDFLRQALAIFDRIGRVGDARRVRSRLDDLS